LLLRFHFTTVAGYQNEKQAITANISNNFVTHHGVASVFNETGAGLRTDSKTGLDSGHFSEPFSSYPTGFTEPTLYSSVATMGSNNLDGNSRLETLMTEALYTNNLTQNEADALSAAGMTSSQVLCYFLPLIFLLSCEMFVPVCQSFNFSRHALLFCLLWSPSHSDYLQRCRKVLSALHYHRTMSMYFFLSECTF
jgi:hypothetical protein